MDSLVSVIIVNYNTEVLLENCILSIKEKTKDVNYEIIVVDNDSESGSLTHLMDKFSDVRFEFIGENLGFGVANNRAVEVAKGEYLLFLNPDTILLNNAIHILLRYMQKDKSIGACGGSLLNEDMSPGLSYFVENRMWQEFLVLCGIAKNKPYIKGSGNREVSGIMGADLFMPRTVFEELNGFDPIFFMYFEEWELCYRVIKHGYKIIHIPEASIMHIQGASAEKKNDVLKKWSYQEHWFSKWVFFHKTEGAFKTKLIYLMSVLKSTLATNFYSLKRNKNKLDYWQLKTDIVKQTYNKYKNKIYA